MSMSALAEIEPTRRLEQLADRANGKHREAYQAAMTMLYAGIEAGEALLKARQLHGRARWVDWCKDNLEFGYTTACSYISVARHKDRILAEDGIDTMQKALRYLRANKLTTQTRIDDARIQVIRETAATHGVNEAARMLGESFGTVQRYASGVEKTKRVKSPISGTYRQITIEDEMVDRMAEWLARRLFKQPLNDTIQALAEEALTAVLDPRAAQLAPRRAALLKIIRELEPVSLRQLVERTGTSQHLQADLQALRHDRLVQVTGSTSAARWHLTETLDRQVAEKHGKGQLRGGAVGYRNEQCRSFVLAHVEEDPGALTEQRLTQAGEWDREDVADACGHLLEEGEIVLRPDGTYAPAEVGLEAAA